MASIEQLESLNILGDVRQRLGANDENDKSFDEKIKNMSNHDIVKQWCGWNLGDESWWTTMKAIFDKLEES